MGDNRTGLGRHWPLALAALLAAAPACAQDSLSVKELLDRAQTKPQTEAVEDLIRKLKGGERPAAKPAEPPRPQAETATPAVPEKASPQATELQAGKGAPGPEQPRPEVAPGVLVPPPAVATAPQRLETPVAPATAPAAPASLSAPALPQELPSVDLEVHFAYKSAEITPQAFELLMVLGRAISDERLAGQTFLIAGHTDAKGGAGYNLKLSQSRAEAVRRFLIEFFAVAPRRLIARGFGDRHLKNSAMPFADENRRVQITNVTRQIAQP